MLKDLEDARLEFDIAYDVFENAGHQLKEAQDEVETAKEVFEVARHDFERAGLDLNRALRSYEQRDKY